jgi:serine/threonine protein kinase
MVHRDIKLTNIGFPVRTNAAMLPENTSTTTSPLQIKLADFGMAGFVEQGA